jgi:hypothetical protein
VGWREAIRNREEACAKREAFVRRARPRGAHDRLVPGDENCWWCAELFIVMPSALCTMLSRLSIGKRAWR